MAIGYLFNGVCHPDIASANQAMYFSPGFATITPGSTSYFQIPVMIGDVVNLQGWTISSTGVVAVKWTKAAPVPLFPNCDTTLGDFAFNPVLFDMIYEKGLLLFSIGLGIGLIISIIRKLKMR